MQTCPTEEVVATARLWDRTGLLERVHLYEQNNEWRPLYACLQEDKQSLFDAIKPSLRLELFRCFYHDMSPDSRHRHLIIPALQKLQSGDAVDAFYHIRSEEMRCWIVQRLKNKSKDRVDEALTGVAHKKKQQSCRSPKDRIHVIVTASFLQSLTEEERRCSSDQCRAGPYSPYGYVVFTSGQRTFHSSCDQSHPGKVNGRGSIEAPLPLRRLPVELWDIIRSDLSKFSVGLLSVEFNLHPPLEIFHQRLWYSIFKNEQWLDHVAKKGGEPGLLLLDRQRRVTLLLHNRQDLDARKLFFDSLRPYTKVSGYEVEIGAIRLNIAVVLDHPYLELSMLENSGRAEYFFWTEGKRSLSTITTSQDIERKVGMGGCFLVKMSLTVLGKEQRENYLFFEDKIWWPSMTEGL